MQYEERKWFKFVHKETGGRERGRIVDQRKRGQVIDKKEEKMPESARIVRCEAVNAYGVGDSP